MGDCEKSKGWRGSQFRKCTLHTPENLNRNWYLFHSSDTSPLLLAYLFMEDENAETKKSYIYSFLHPCLQTHYSQYAMPSKMSIHILQRLALTLKSSINSLLAQQHFLRLQSIVWPSLSQRSFCKPFPLDLNRSRPVVMVSQLCSVGLSFPLGCKLPRVETVSFRW